MLGGVTSLTLSWKVQDAELPAASVAVIVVMIRPGALTVVPAAGDWLKFGAPQLSEALVIEEKLGTVAVQLAPSERT
jgi:hypothetical protein